MRFERGKQRDWNAIQNLMTLMSWEKWMELGGREGGRWVILS